MDEFATWKPIPPEELAEMKEGEPVVVLTTEWKRGKRLDHYEEANFRGYSAGRGLVRVDIPNDLWNVTEVCDANIGRCGIPEHEELHGDFEGYYE